MVLGISFNLCLLGIFKYTDFFLENFNALTHSSFPLLHLALPLAISFFTFQQIAYLCDTYKYTFKDSFLDYALFITFFPQLIAGPIVHHKEMMPQFKTMQFSWFNAKHFASGLFIFSIGLFKKVVIADSFAIYANNGFNAAFQGTALNFFESWLTSLSYTFQLYFDFSGYCDMAIGIALLFNIVLPINFNSPYKALSIQDFWKRWHITLGRFLTHYLYIPLGGSTQGKIKTLRNLGIVFLLSGIWHGAGWGFILWGVLHSFAMIVHKIYTYLLDTFKWKRPNGIFYKIFCWILTFNFINSTWVFFRSDNLSSAWSILKGMIGGNGVVVPAWSYPIFEKFQTFEHYVKFGRTFYIIAPFEWREMLVTTLISMIICLCFKNTNQLYLHFRPSLFSLFFMLGIGYFGFLSLNRTSHFLYFNF